MKQPTFEIEFKGMRNFDTLEEAKAFKTDLKDRYRAMQKCSYNAIPELNLPEIVFYTVYFETEGA